jgi:hypothetical protein
MDLHKPDQATHAAVVNSANAPFVYADGVIAYGSSTGEVQIELAANTLLPSGDGVTTRGQLVVTAHLRCGRTAALDIRRAIDQALALADNAEKLFAVPTEHSGGGAQVKRN